MFKGNLLRGLGLLLMLCVSLPVFAQQYARPNSTVSAGGFTAVNAPTLWEAVDDPASTSDYINSGNGNNNTVILGLSAVTNPGTYSNNHIIRYSCRSSGSGGPERCDAALYQGNTLIGGTSNQSANRGAFATVTYTITDASTITDYSALQLRLTSSSLGGAESVQIAWAELEVPGQAAVAPTVDTPTWADVTDRTATLGGRVVADGGATVTARGIEWGTNAGGPYPNPVPAGSGGVGTFTVPVTGLPSSSTIYFRAWATNSADTGYSGQNQFDTNAPALPPAVDSPSWSGVTANTAVLGGRVTADGGATVTDRGIIWNTTSPADSGGTSVSMGSGLGTFSQQVAALPANTQIFFKAYATNSAGTSYSAVEEAFVTLVALGPPTVANIAETSADLGGEVLAGGNRAVTGRGIVWHTSSPPESGGTVVPMGSGEGTFSQNVALLPNETLVYFRAYADNEAGRGYSGIDSFTPSVPKTAPVIDTPTAVSITHNSAVLGGTIRSDGGSPILERGTVWNLTGNPGIGDNKAAAGGTAIGAFSHTRTMPPGQTVYYQAYATNAQGTTLTTGNNSLTTLTQPTVQASNVTFSRTSARGMRITWTRGNGEGSIVVVRPTLGTTRADPVDGVNYVNANHIFRDAQEITGTQNYVVYKGTNRYVDVGLMTANTSYSVAVYEYTSSSGTWDYLQANPAQGVNSTTNQPMHNSDVGAECGDCHDAHTSFLPHDTEQEDLCRTCHNPSGDASGKLEFALHTAPNKNPVLTYVDCGFCHELHKHSAENTTLAYNSITTNIDYNKSYLRANVDKYVTTATTDDAFLHNDTYDAADAANALTPERAVEGGSETTARGYCQVCHSYTKYHRGQQVLTPDRPNPGDLPANQCHDGDGRTGGPGACESGNPETNCGRCHQHNNNFRGVGGSQTCVECHSSAIESRREIVPEFDRLSTHITGGSTVVTQPDCQVCHDGAHSGNVTVKDADDGSIYTYAGQPEAYEPHCLSCHDDGLASNLPASGADQTQSSPFTGSGAPPVIGETMWLNSAHNRDSGSFPDSPVSCVGNGSNGCHASGHGADRTKLLNTAPVFPAGAGSSVLATDFCINCHDTDGPSSINIAAQFSGNATQTTSASNALVNNRHDVRFDDQQYSSSTITCKDCHLPHADTDANPVRNPDTGAAIPAYSYTNTNYNSGGDLDPLNPAGNPSGGFSEPDTIEFCLVCHDNTPPAGSGASMNSSRPLVDMAAAWVTDQHGKNTCCSSGNGYLKYPWQPNGTTSDVSGPYAALTCTTCHGAHGTGSIFNLRTSIKVAGVQMSTGGWSGDTIGTTVGTTYVLPGTDHNWGAWCSFCHQHQAHKKSLTTNCTGGHMHGGQQF